MNRKLSSVILLFSTLLCVWGTSEAMDLKAECPEGHTNAQDEVTVCHICTPYRSIQCDSGSHIVIADVIFGALDNKEECPSQNCSTAILCEYKMKRHCGNKLFLPFLRGCNGQRTCNINHGSSGEVNCTNTDTKKNHTTGDYTTVKYRCIKDDDRPRFNVCGSEQISRTAGRNAYLTSPSFPGADFSHQQRLCCCRVMGVSAFYLLHYDTMATASYLIQFGEMEHSEFQTVDFQNKIANVYIDTKKSDTYYLTWRQNGSTDSGVFIAWLKRMGTGNITVRCGTTDCPSPPTTATRQTTPTSTINTPSTTPTSGSTASTPSSPATTSSITTSFTIPISRSTSSIPSSSSTTPSTTTFPTTPTAGSTTSIPHSPTTIPTTGVQTPATNPSSTTSKQGGPAGLENEDEPPTGLIAGIAVGALVLIAVAVTAVVCLVRRRRNLKEPENELDEIYTQPTKKGDGSKAFTSPSDYELHRPAVPTKSPDLTDADGDYTYVETPDVVPQAGNVTKRPIISKKPQKPDHIYDDAYQTVDEEVSANGADQTTATKQDEPAYQEYGETSQGSKPEDESGYQEYDASEPQEDYSYADRYRPTRIIQQVQDNPPALGNDYETAGSSYAYATVDEE